MCHASTLARGGRGEFRAISGTQWRNVAGHVVCIMGGDGTVSLIMSAMDDITYPGGHQPLLLVLPLGTGNDLARALGCGSSAGNVAAVLRILKRIPYESPDATTYLDRWHVHTPGPEHRVFNNYLSFGFDARVIGRFHAARDRHPSLYQFQHVNYFWYFIHSCASMFNNPPLHNVATLIVDGIPVEVTSLRPGTVSPLIALPYTGMHCPDSRKGPGPGFPQHPLVRRWPQYVSCRFRSSSWIPLSHPRTALPPQTLGVVP